ncbi:MAG: twin-arginine translocase subunit TatB [Thiomicrospira sp.]|uniref:Sec-independent protein translocase protein TatB n=1 Tax=Thiomicrospira sp. TaxID=935 RepID=UPI0019E578EC|nr:Sec-independent protein translocase protein TatB [Thiomicrospira sp.]MBE0493048.1 twin-arginine translocase subunit TatB [Thiomicrospira sp.]
MFDIGFLEIIIILIITLMVVGPERMPEVARKAGEYLRKMRNFINSVKDDSNLRETVRELQDAVDVQEHKREFDHIKQDLYKGFEDVQDQINFDELQRPFSNPEPTQADIEQAQRQLDSTNDVAQDQTETPPSDKTAKNPTDSVQTVNPSESASKSNV